MEPKVDPRGRLLEAKDVERFGARAKIAPPLRSTLDRAELWYAVADGRIDTIASDHCGYDRSEKEPFAVSFGAAGFGAPGVETLLPLLLDSALRNAITLERMVDLLAESPARIFGLGPKGRIAAGLDADLVVVDPTARATIEASRHDGAAYYSLFEGRRLRGSIRQVYLRGKAIVQDGAFATDERVGRFVPIRPVAAD